MAQKQRQEIQGIKPANTCPLCGWISKSTTYVVGGVRYNSLKALGEQFGMSGENARLSLQKSCILKGKLVRVEIQACLNCRIELNAINRRSKGHCSKDGCTRPTTRKPWLKRRICDPCYRKQAKQRMREYRARKKLDVRSNPDS